MAETYKIFNKTKHVNETEMIKKIIYYCKKCNYVLSYSNYDKLEDIISDAHKIKYFGNEPSVRRAIRLLNKDNKIKEPVPIIMSAKCKERLDRLELVKKNNSVKFKINRGTINVIFD